MPLLRSTQRWFSLLGLVGLLGCGLSTAPSESTDPFSPVPLDPDQLIQIDAAETGLIQVPVSDLFQGVNAWPSPIHLSTEGLAIPYFLNESGDTLYFWAEVTETRYTSTQPYIINFSQQGPVATGRPIETSALGSDSLITRVTFEENNRYLSTAHAGDADVWFWDTIQADSQYEVDLGPLVPSDGSGWIQIELYGQTFDTLVDGDHTLSVSLNGVDLGRIVWDGATHHTAELQIPPNTIRDQANQLLLDNGTEPDEGFDVMLLNRIELLYQTRPEPRAGVLSFSGASGAVNSRNWDVAPLIVDTTDPRAPIRLTYPADQFQDGTLRFATDPDRSIWMSDPHATPKPARISTVADSGLAERETQTDFIILGPADFESALSDLVATREEEGLSTVYAPIESVYDEFGDGVESPEVIQRFLTYAATSWPQPAPRYLLLVGPARNDFNNYLGQAPLYAVPSLIIPVEHSGETVSDIRLTDLDQDFLPDLAVGRWPVETEAEAADLVARTLAYESTPPAESALFVSDSSDGRFATSSHTLANNTNFGDRAVTLDSGDSDQFIADYGAGQWLVSYVGHGSLSLWGNDQSVSIDTVGQLSQNAAVAPPIVTQFTCLSGYYAHPTQRSLSEQLLFRPDGPVLILGASSLTYSSDQLPFAESLLLNLQDPAVVRMGDALNLARRDLNLADEGVREVSDTFALFGDPTARINRFSP